MRGRRQGHAPKPFLKPRSQRQCIENVRILLVTAQQTKRFVYVGWNACCWKETLIIILPSSKCSKNINGTVKGVACMGCHGRIESGQMATQKRVTCKFLRHVAWQGGAPVSAHGLGRLVIHGQVGVIRFDFLRKANIRQRVLMCAIHLGFWG